MKLFKQFSLYTFVGFFGAGINFILMPYLSHYINPAGYGILSMVNSMVAIFIPLVGLTAFGLITVEYYRVKDKEEFASIFSSVQAIPIVPGIVILLVSLVFSSQIAAFLEIPKEKSYWVPVSAAIALFSIYAESLTSFIIIEQKAKLYVKYSVARILLEVGLTLLFVSVFKLSWEGRLLSWLIATIFSFIVSIFYFKSLHLLTLNLKRKYIWAGLVFGLPLILHTISKFVIGQSDRVFIAKMVSIDEAGIYNIGYQVGMVVLIIVNAMGNFLQPFIFERLANLTNKAKIEIVRISYIIIIGLLILLFSLTLIAPLLFQYLIDKNYLGGIVFVFWTGLSYFLWGVYIVFAGYIFYLKKTKILAYLAILNVILNISLNYFLILKYGALGASYATCISYFVIMIIIIMKATSFYSLPWFKFRLVFQSKYLSK